MIVTENANREATEKLDPVTESIRPFHPGPLRRCSRCGRKVFLPCLACQTELEGKVNDPFETTEEEPLHIQLEGEQRQRYEYLRLKKVSEAVRRQDREGIPGVSWTMPGKYGEKHDR